MDYISRLYSYNEKTENIYLEKVTIPGPGILAQKCMENVKMQNIKLSIMAASGGYFGTSLWIGLNLMTCCTVSFSITQIKICISITKWFKI